MVRDFFPWWAGCEAGRLSQWWENMVDAVHLMAVRKQRGRWEKKRYPSNSPPVTYFLQRGGLTSIHYEVISGLIH
jgi:hypothetical protein